MFGTEGATRRNNSSRLWLMYMHAQILTKDNTDEIAEGRN